MHVDSIAPKTERYLMPVLNEFFKKCLLSHVPISVLYSRAYLPDWFLSPCGRSSTLQTSTGHCHLALGEAIIYHS